MESFRSFVLTEYPAYIKTNELNKNTLTKLLQYVEQIDVKLNPLLCIILSQLMSFDKLINQCPTLYEFNKNSVSEFSNWAKSQQLSYTYITSMQHIYSGIQKYLTSTSNSKMKLIDAFPQYIKYHLRQNCLSLAMFKKSLCIFVSWIVLVLMYLFLFKYVQYTNCVDDMIINASRSLFSFNSTNTHLTEFGNSGMSVILFNQSY